MHKPELLVPAGGWEQLEAAILYGADAVYLGGSELSLRAKCEGFNSKKLEEAVKKAHSSGVRVYYCLNALPYDKHLPAVEEQLELLPDIGVDGLIAADPGVIRLARQICPSVSIHLSTQAHTSNASSVKFWCDAGINRINLARELDAKAIRNIIQKFPQVEFEVFVHGAMCLSLSGHCLISAWVNQRPANLGLCTQPCRFEYKGITLTVEEAIRKDGPFLDIQQGEDFSSIWAPMDLCLIRWMNDLVSMGAAALKIEGRTKSGSYVAQATDAYRTALNAQLNQTELPLSMDDMVLELMHTASRPLCSGFFLADRRIEAIPEGFAVHPVAGRILGPAAHGGWEIQVRSPWDASADVSVLVPGMHRPVLKAGSYVLENHKGERTDRLNPGLNGILYAEEMDIRPGLYIRA